MTRAIVIGKFYPPHLGHTYLINYVLNHSDQLTILVCDNPTYRIPAYKRQQWLQEIHPEAEVRIIPDLNDDDNSKAWAQHTLRFLGYTPDVVFSSEEYGTAYARYMHTRHVMVDQHRTHVPVSGTRVRDDLFKEWTYLHPVVKRDLALRIVIVGAESTGTTTLATELSERNRIPIVLEYGRTYSESFATATHNWIDEEFTHIATVQQNYEATVATHSQGIVIADTNAFATALWQKRYLGHTSKDVTEIAKKDIADYYILTGDEIPFVQDGIRDGEHIRHDMHTAFLQKLKKQPVPFSVIRGTKNERFQKAQIIVDSFLKNSKRAFELSSGRW